MRSALTCENIEPIAQQNHQHRPLAEEAAEAAEATAALQRAARRRGAIIITIGRGSLRRLTPFSCVPVAILSPLSAWTA